MQAKLNKKQFKVFYQFIAMLLKSVKYINAGRGFNVYIYILD